MNTEPWLSLTSDANEVSFHMPPFPLDSAIYTIEQSMSPPIRSETTEARDNFLNHGSSIIDARLA